MPGGESGSADDADPDDADPDGSADADPADPDDAGPDGSADADPDGDDDADPADLDDTAPDDSDDTDPDEADDADSSVTDDPDDADDPDESDESDDPDTPAPDSDGEIVEHPMTPQPTPEAAGESDDSEGADGAAGTTEAADGGARADALGLEAPESDEEMPLADHIEEMMRRLAVVFVFGGLATLVAVTESTELINYFWSYHIPAPMENRPRLYGPLELPLTQLKVAGLAGVVVGLPAFVYQTYRFMKPGLYTQERRYYLAAVPTSLVLGGIGVAFAHFLVLPAIFSYFTTYTADAATIAFGLAETFNLIVIMLAFMAIVFQIPLFIMLAIMMGIVTRKWLEEKRLIFWGAFLGIAFLFSPDPTGMAPIIVTLTMIVLYEGTLAILRWTGN
ncbi:MFS transporter [Halorubrum sp. CBA1125]|nr:MFS transporter [Halorubrum sp. CBA1125]